MMIKLSIIIPVYNLENYISRCLDSCLEQDLSKDEYEIICIDDGSNDNSLSILNKYSEENTNIKVIHKENGGVSSARNMGLENACGEYIWFVDGDDYISKRCLGFLYDAICSNKADLMIFDCENVKKSDLNVQCDNNAMVTYYDNRKSCFSIYPKHHYANGPVFFWFRRKIILENDIRFEDNMKYGEDTFFCFEYKLCCSNCVLVDGIFYYYFQHQNSTMHTVNLYEHFQCMKKIGNRCNQEINKAQHGVDDILDLLITKRNAAVQAMLWDMMFGSFSYEEIVQEIKELEQCGMYPHKVRVGRNKNKKQFIINLVSYFLKYKYIYLFFARIIKTKKRCIEQ